MTPGSTLPERTEFRFGQGYELGVGKSDHPLACSPAGW
jgi:hypothetical protein